jgi:pyruvate formate lyase activating enzyme
MRCPYCYNPYIVEGEGLISNHEILSFLESRVDRLDGVVLSGGECTLNPDILRLCNQIKKLGFKIKIDTNGLRPEVLEELIDYSLVDFIALDYKAPKYKFQEITKAQSSDKFFQTLDMLLTKDIPFEVRTTVHPDLLNEEDINSIISDLKQRDYKGTYYLQNYLHVEETIGHTSPPTKRINKDLLINLIPIEFRN